MVWLSFFSYWSYSCNTCRYTSLNCSPSPWMEYFANNSYACPKDKYAGCGFRKKDSDIPWHGTVFACKETTNGSKWLGSHHTSPGNICMAMLRTIGSSVENSGIDMCWVESERYGPSMVRQILDGNHVKRGENALSQPYRPCSLRTRKPFSSNIRSYTRLFRVWHKSFVMHVKIAQEPKWRKHTWIWSVL